MSGGNEREQIFDRLRRHDARDIVSERLKFRWRYTTLQSDINNLQQAHDLEMPHSTERSQQLETQGYVFEVERQIHHYLSGLYTLLQQQDTLQNGVGRSFQQDLQEVKDDYMSGESSRTVVGLRHYVQHENVLPIKPRTSHIDETRSLIVMVDDLHREDEDRDFEQHFGHIEYPYINPVEHIIDDWSNVERFFEQTVQVMEEQASEEIEELQLFMEEADDLYEELIRDHM